jgi:hypothetical protein
MDAARPPANHTDGGPPARPGFRKMAQHGDQQEIRGGKLFERHIR